MGRLTCALTCALTVSLALPALGGELEERLAACQETNADCREDCTTAYGSSFKLREQLGRCLLKCEKRNGECRGRHIELDQAGIDENGYERKRPGQELAEEPERRPSETKPRAAKRAEQAAREERAERPAEKPAPKRTDKAAAAAPDEAPAEGTSRPAPTEEDAVREAAKKLMKKGAEEWNPDGD